jgi:hypothetical protein
VNALFASIGVDYVQWKAVSRTLLRSDFRAPAAQSGETYSLGSVSGLLLLAFVFGMFGVAMVPLIILNADLRLTGTVTLTYLTFALATSLLSQHGATMLAPTDHVILGSRPVTSRTVFAIRLTNVLFHTGLITTFVALAPVVVFTLAHGASVGRGLGAVAAIYAWSLAVSFAVVAGYAAVVSWIGGARLQRVVAYLQLVTGVVAYGGIFLVNRIFDRESITQATLPDTAWLLLVPPAWFASYLEIGGGAASMLTWIRAVLSLAALAMLGAVLHGKLSLGYAARVSEPSEVTAPAVRRGRSPRLFARNEARAVALLTLAHFRHDMRVRMSLFSVVPLLLIYLLMGARAGNTDPFLGPTSQRGPDVLPLAALLFPALIMRNLEMSEGFKASWIYTVTTADRGKLILALKNIAAAYFLGPFTIIMAGLFSWRFGNALHGCVHAVLLAAAGYIALQVAMLLNPRLPFAHPPEKSGSATLFAWMLFVMVGGQLLVIGLQRFVYPSWTRIAFSLMSAALASMLIERLLHRRVAHKSR